jgi:hypothetical protein
MSAVLSPDPAAAEGGMGESSKDRNNLLQVVRYGCIMELSSNTEDK